MVYKTIIALILISITNLNCVENGYIDRIKSSEIVSESHELCNYQFESFVQLLKIGEKWANDSEYLKNKIKQNLQ